MASDPDGPEPEHREELSPLVEDAPSDVTKVAVRRVDCGAGERYRVLFRRAEREIVADPRCALAVWQKPDLSGCPVAASATRPSGCMAPAYKGVRFEVGGRGGRAAVASAPLAALSLISRPRPCVRAARS